MENYNKKARNLINDIFIYILFKKEEKDNSYIKVMEEYLLGIAFLDTYKINSFLEKNCLITKEQENNFKKIVKIKSIDELKELIKDNTFKASLFTSSMQFNSLNGLGKMLLTKSLTKEENTFLTNLYPYHEYDLQTYGKKITLSHLKSYKRKKDASNDKDEYALINIIGCIKLLKQIDFQNYLSLISEIALEDYASNNRQSFYETKTKKEIIDKFNDPLFLEEALTSALEEKKEKVDSHILELKLKDN